MRGSADSLWGQIAAKQLKDCHVARITEQCDLNKAETRKVSLARSCEKHRIPVLLLISPPCAGGTSWSYINLTLPRNREKVITAWKKFSRFWASFADLSDSLEKVSVHYALEWPKHCVCWEWNLVRTLVESRPLRKAHFDGCRCGLMNRKARQETLDHCDSCT